MTQQIKHDIHRKMRTTVFFAVLAIFFTTLPVVVNAATKTSPKAVAKTTITAMPTTPATPSSTYQLAYPGILPDSPLYKVKLLRDKVLLFLTRDPYKRTERYILFADKTLNASSQLVDKGNIPLAVHTAFRGEHYMTLMVDEFKSAVYSGRDFNMDLAKKAYEASDKHLEVLRSMKSKATGEEQFATIEEFSIRNKKSLEELQEEVKGLSEENFATPSTTPR